MSKILSCLFWKSKTKSFSKKESKSILNSHVETKRPIINKGDKYRRVVKSQIVLPLYTKNKGSSLNEGRLTTYVGLKSQTKKFKSYPVSPRTTLLEDKGYLSDQNLCRMSNNLQSRHSKSVLSTSTPQNSSKCPRATLGSSEPFPFQVPKDVAPRQSLFYELRYGSTDDSETNENLKHKADKQVEDYNDLITSWKNASQSSTYNRQLQNQDNLESQNGKSITRRTIHHVRPVSVQKVPRQSTTFKTAQADSSAMVPNKSFVHQLQLKPTNKTPLLITNEGKALHPLKKDKVRTSFFRSGNEVPPVRVSVVKPVKLLEQEEVAPTIPIRTSVRRSSIKNSPDTYRDLEAESLNRLSLLSERETSPSFMENGEDLNMFPTVPARSSIRKSSVRLASVSKENNVESNAFPFGLTENQPVVYAVPVVPTRGRSKSLLQQSVKSLASKNQKEEPVIYRKNIRYSMDTDVFSAETRRRSVSPAPQGFVNMERGQPMLVSEVLNPITSLFISDLKNPPPKDPLTKPKEANVWVKPRSYSVQRSSLSRQPPKASTRAKAYESPAQTVPVQRRLSRKSRYKYQDESSSSDESIVVYRKKSKQSAPRRSYQHAVYAAQMPKSVLPQPEHNKRNSLYFPEKSEHEVDMDKTSSSNDICGLTLGSDQKIFENLQLPYHVKMVSSAQQTDIDNELDLMCYPYESVLNKSVVSSESGSKLRWRIIIKRGDEK